MGAAPAARADPARQPRLPTPPNPTTVRCQHPPGFLGYRRSQVDRPAGGMSAWVVDDSQRHRIRLRDSCTWLHLRAAMVDRAFSVTVDASLALAPRPDRRFLSADGGASRVTVGTLCPTVRSWPGGALRAAQGLSHR